MLRRSSPVYARAKYKCRCRTVADLLTARAATARGRNHARRGTRQGCAAIRPTRAAVARSRIVAPLKKKRRNQAALRSYLGRLSAWLRCRSPFARLAQLVIQLATTDRRNQGVDDCRQLLQCLHDNASLALVELHRLS